MKVGVGVGFFVVNSGYVIISSAKGDVKEGELPEHFACPIPPSMRSILTGRGQVSLGRLANRFGSCIGTNTKPLHRVISPPSTPNHYSICPSVSLADTLEREPEHISRTDRISARQQKSAAANGVSKSSSEFQLQAL